MLQEDTIRCDNSLRGQPHWVDFSKHYSGDYKVNILKLNPSLYSNSQDSKISDYGISVFYTSIFNVSLWRTKKNKGIKKIKRAKFKLYRDIIRVNNYLEKYFLIKMLFLFKQAEMMGAVALLTNTKVFLFREAFYPLTDAMTLIAPEINVTTIAYQYSNLSNISPLMMSTADKQLIFSNLYRKIYQVDGISPLKLEVTGYLYDGIINLLKEKAYSHRKKMLDSGANFVICYFNESVQGKNRWGLVSEKSHLTDLHILAKIVLEDPSIAVLIKSQFIRTSPCNLHKDDMLIQNAVNTGRFLDLNEGFKRNDIYPAEAALASDICISHKFGATAAIESAVSKVRTVLIDSYGAVGLWDEIYAQADIVYKSMEEIMKSITKYRNNDKDYRSLGDWSTIIHNFDPFCDESAVERLQNCVAAEVK